MSCSKCEKEILYNPLQCELCGANLCIFCCDDTGNDNDNNNSKNNLILCEICTIMQLSELKNIEDNKCEEPDCDYFAEIVQNCTSYRLRKNRKNKHYTERCSTKLKLCKLHVKRCYCGEIICARCHNDGGCWKHQEKCDTCHKYFNIKLLNTCDICNHFRCQRCSMYTMITSTAEPVFSICIDHSSACTCKLGRIFKLQMFVCSKVGCAKYVCTNSMFGDPNNPGNRICACHGHQDGCQACGKYQPSNTLKPIRFRNKMIIACCYICFNRTRRGFETIKLCLMQYNIKVPNDIFDMILKLSFEMTA